MIAASGIFQDGAIRLDSVYVSKKPVKVIVTFLEEVEPVGEVPLKFDDFSFAKSREVLANYKGSFSDDVIEDRRGEL